jgi:two-component system cell cycle sensor histidine kinase/response regulator CckA
MVLEAGARETGPASADAALVEVARGTPAAFYQFRLSPSGVRSISFASPAFMARFGIEPGDPEEKAALYFSRVHPEDLPSVNDALARSARTLKTFEREFRFRLPSGAEIWVEARSDPRRMPDGGVLWNGIATDITRRKRAEEALRESELHFRTLFQTTTFGIVSQDRDGKIVMANSAAERILGLGERQLFALTSDDPRWRAIHEDGSPSPGDGHPATVALRTGKPVSGVVMGVWNPVLGSHVWLLVNAVPEFRPGESGPFRVWVTFEDITERKKTEANVVRLNTELEEALSWQRQIFEGSRDAVFLSDEEGRFAVVNRAATELTGFAREELLTMTIPDLHEEPDLGAFRAFHRRILAGERLLSAAPIRRKDGTKVAVEFNNSLIVIGGKRFMHTAARDVTERRNLEEQLRQAQKMDAIGQLAGGVAHDFNNLLTVISGNTELLLLNVGAEDPKRGALTDIRKASERAASLTRQLLAFSRRQVLDPRLVDVHDVIAGIEKMLRRLIGENVELASDLAADPSWVNVDPGQLDQVVMNLALNARDAMPRGGRITIRTRNLEPAEPMDLEETAGRRLGPKVAISISDTGAGIHPELKPRLFEPFFTTKEFGKGSGLGLATVHGIVKQSGGDISVESEPGRGATFTVILPSQPAPRLRGGSSTSLRALPRGTETVLLVDDEDAVRRIVKITLESMGYRVIEARNGPEALEAARLHSETIHLVVTDVVMPEMSGRDLAERLTKDHPGVQILYMSGYTDDAVLRNGIVEPGVSFLQKPFSPLTLARKVREVLDEPG